MLYGIETKDQERFVSLGFGQDGYYVRVEDKSRGHVVSTSYGFGFKALDSAKQWFEKSSGYTLKEVRKLNKGDKNA